MDKENAAGRELIVDGLVNARDLGGLQRRDGSRTPFGVFFRSESLDRVTERGWKQIRASGIRSVVDLRQPRERERDVSERPGWLTIIEVDLDGLENELFWKDYWSSGLVGTALYFRPHLDAMPERAVQAVSAIVSAPPGGVLFHCMSGRDRTGMISMLLLAAIGTESEEIVDDYLDTVRRGDVRGAALGIQDREPEIEALCRTLGTTTEGAFRSALDGLDHDAILSAGGLSLAHRRSLNTWRGSIL